MEIKRVNDINLILTVHKEIFQIDFDIQNYQKRAQQYPIYIFIYMKKKKIIGYSLIIDEQEDKNLYFWYGGVVQSEQGKGITNRIFDIAISMAKSKAYKSITVATLNKRTHMLKFAIKKGFNIFKVKKRSENNDINKIYFKYNLPMEGKKNYKIDVSSKNMGELENEIIDILKSNNCKKLIIKNAKKNIHLLIYILEYCNTFIDIPQVCVTKIKNRDFKRLKRIFKGKIKNKK
ncbi:MAG: hypothetical protein Q4G05_04655 [Clostridia bacterium]|nr:hypothetical protein [Clostridia bacterium]